MDFVQAIILGILQGLTEFFPVSSSGHLALFGHWFGLQPDLTFDILVHLATLAAIVVYFRKDWIQLARLLLGKDRGDLPPKILLYLIVSMIPAGLVGVLLKDNVAWFHDKNVWVGVFLFITGTILLMGLRISKSSISLKNMTFTIVIAMAIAQAFAILPGISRAGMTIMVGLFLGLERQGAARFSFLMAVPVIGGAGLLAILDLLENAQSMSSQQITAYGVGFVAALVSGFLALAFLMKLLNGKRFFYFGFYCFAMGLAACIF